MHTILAGIELKRQHAELLELREQDRQANVVLHELCRHLHQLVLECRT